MIVRVAIFAVVLSLGSLGPGSIALAVTKDCADLLLGHSYACTFSDGRSSDITVELIGPPFLVHEDHDAYLWVCDCASLGTTKKPNLEASKSFQCFVLSPVGTTIGVVAGKATATKITGSHSFI